MLKLSGQIVEIKTRLDASSDVVQRLVLVIHSDLGELREYFQKPIHITLDVMME